MAFEKGKSGNPKGKPPGTQNKIGSHLREMIGNFLNNNFSLIEKDFKKLPPKDRAKLYCDLLQYGLPKLQSVEFKPDIERLPDDQLLEIILKLINSKADEKK